MNVNDAWLIRYGEQARSERLARWRFVVSTNQLSFFGRGVRSGWFESLVKILENEMAPYKTRRKTRVLI